MIDRDNYNKIFDNGVNHINSAKTLADNGSFGFAISHLILGIEELIKYQVTMSYSANDTSFDKEANPQNRKTIYKDHLTKHGLIKEFQQAMSKEFTEKFQEYVFYKATSQELKPEHLEIEKNRFKEWGNILHGAFKETNIPENDRQDFFDWLGKANDLKNKGFYVNLNNGACESPKDISKHEYLTGLKYAEAILKQTEVIKSLDITDDEFMNFLNEEVDFKLPE